jgi:hypothetical protein
MYPIVLLISCLNTDATTEQEALVDNVSVSTSSTPTKDVSNDVKKYVENNVENNVEKKAEREVEKKVEKDEDVQPAKSAFELFYQDVERDERGLQTEVYLTIAKDGTVTGEYIDWWTYDIYEERFESTGMETLQIKGQKVGDTLQLSMEESTWGADVDAVPWTEIIEWSWFETHIVSPGKQKYALQKDLTTSVKLQYEAYYQKNAQQNHTEEQ